jgi:hypothetical protein
MRDMWHGIGGGGGYGCITTVYLASRGLYLLLVGLLFDTEDAGNTLLRNVMKYLPDYMP